MDEIECVDRYAAIMTELSAIRTDVSWLKRLFLTTIVVVAGLLGIDASGLIA